MKITVYGMNRPSRATRVAWALEEAGADWTHEAVDPRSPDYAAINPFGKVPALSIDGRILTESAACCMWVADAFPAAALAPALGTFERADHDRWVHFAISELEQPLWVKAKHTFALAEEHRVPGLKPTLIHEFDRAAAVLEQALDGRSFLVGDRFTVADLLNAHTLFWAQQAKFELSDALRAYAGHHSARPALARAMAKSRPA